MATKNDLLIVEMSSSQLKVAEGENKDYILEGIFGEIDSKNKNNRIYTEDEYVPQIQQLQDKIKSSKLLGELDHPQQFDVSLKNVSHIIEELYYDKDNKHVKGKIRLLDTDAGRQAKALVDAGVPLQISSRAAGAVESNGKVKIKQLFTYDLVADPGFANAELKRVNESYGFDNESGLWIYEMNGEGAEAPEVAKENITETNIENINNKNMAEFVKAEDFQKYSEYLATEIKSLKESIGAQSEDNTIEDVKSHNDHIVERVNTLSEYVEYVAGKLDESIQYTEHVAEKTDESISYSEHVAEKLDQGIQYSEHLAEALGKVKDFTNYLAEAHNEGTETSKNVLEYIDYLKENIQNVSEYAEYIATQINEGLTTEEVEGEEAGEPAEDLEDELVKSDAEVEDETEEAEKGESGPETDGGEDGTKEVAEDEEVEETEETEEVAEEEGEEVAEEESEEVAEEDEAGEGAEEVVEDEAGEGAEEVVEEEGEEVAEEETEEVAEAEEGEDGQDEVEEPGQEKEDAEGDIEEIGNNDEEGDVDPAGEEAGEPAEDLEDETVKSDAEVEDETEEAEAGESEEEAEGEDGAHDPLESYKKEISSKLDALVEAAQVKENENPSFLNVVSSSTQDKYNALNEDAKTEVRGRVSKRAFMNESQITAIIENAEAVVESRNTEPFFMSAMPTEYKEKFEALTEGKQNQIKAQANYHTLKTEYQVRNFWETRDLREVKVDLEKLAAVNESAVTEKKDEPLYDVSNYAESLKKRFKK